MPKSKLKSKTTSNRPAQRRLRVQRLVRPNYVPKLSCGRGCGHSEQEHVAFDLGVYDGANGTTIPPIQCSIESQKSKQLREAWLTGHSVGVMLRPNDQKLSHRRTPTWQTCGFPPN